MVSVIDFRRRELETARKGKEKRFRWSSNICLLTKTGAKMWVHFPQTKCFNNSLEIKIIKNTIP